MKNLSTDPITDGTPLTPVERTFFDDLTKSAEDLQTNQDETVSGTNPNQAPPPDNARSDDPTWSEEPGPDFTNAARQQFIAGREKLLEELLPGASSTSDPAEKKLVSEVFETSQYETSSPQLQKSASTLNERVRQLCGRD